MASAGMLHRGRNTGPESGDEVQRSLELLDSVLSEFEEGDRVSVGGGVVVEVPSGGAIGGVTTASVTPDDDSPSLGGHQSEDDGYMSMNGRRTKFALSFRPTEEKGEPIITSECQTNDISPSNISVSKTISLESETNEESLSPPPPSEAERIICTLLPKVSPSNTSKNIISKESDKSSLVNPEDGSFKSIDNSTHSSTQTTLPKTRHQRPYGWEKEGDVVGNPTSHVQCKFSSLQHGSHQPPNTSSSSWLPIRYKKDCSPKNGSPNNGSPKKINAIKSPTTELPKKSFPLTSSFSYDNDFVLGNMPYNEHPVTIYPGANVPYTKQLNSPTYNLPKNSPLSTSFAGRSAVSGDSKAPSKKENKSDGETLSPANKVPPRTLAGSIERHREVCRRLTENASPNKRASTDTCDDEDHFSDDSLEESLPPPPPALTPSKRGSIAWEVSLDGDDPLLTPGSTKVVGRRRRKSGDQSNSSTSSIPQRVEEWISESQGDYWPPPPMQCSTEDEIASPYSDTNSDHLPIPEDITEINATGTYIIRRGKKDRKNLPHFDKKSHKSNSKNDHHIENDISHKILDGDQSIDGSSLSISGISTSGSHNSVSSLNSRLSSDLSIPHSRYSIDFNSRFSRELTTPNSRFSVDLCLPQTNSLKKELTSPKSRLSLDLNNGQDKYLAKDFFNGSPKNKKLDNKKLEINIPNVNKTSPVANKLSPQNRFVDFKKYSCTFDNIQSLMKEGVESSICGPQFDETSSDLEIVTPSVVRVVSLPSLNADSETPAARQILTTTMEEEEDFESPSQSSEDNSPLKKIENNISALLNQGRDQQYNQYLPKDWDIHKDEYCNTHPSDSNVTSINNISFNSGERHKRNEIQKSSSHNEIPNKRMLDYHREKPKRNGIHKSLSSKDMPVSLNRQMSSSDSTGSSGGDFPIHVQIVKHNYKTHLHDFGPLPDSPGSPQFPPLPPSPVQEDDEYSEILQPLEKMHVAKSKDVLPAPNSDMYLRSLDGPMIPPHREMTTNSLKTRSMDTSFCKNRRNNNSNKSMSTDRRTLPSDMGVMSGRRRTFQRQRGREDGSGGSGLQTSASLPETPVFGRGVDVPRTPHRRTTDGPRISSTMNSIQTMSGSCTVGGYGRGTGSMERALAGAELIRLAGGPARGWYPKQRHRPASIEHLERLPLSASINQNAGPWDSSRKPLTLPPNLTPKFFQKSPRDALRRVTSLLIRKGNGSKDPAKKEKQAVSPAARSANGEETAQKQRKGFFKNFWKRSRHYSLEHP